MSDQQSDEYAMEHDLKTLAVDAANGQFQRLKKKRGRPRKRSDNSDQALSAQAKRLPQSYRLKETTVRTIDQLMFTMDLERSYDVVELAVSLCELMVAAGYDVHKLASRYEKAKLLTLLAAEFSNNTVPVVNLSTLISDAKTTS